MSANIDKSLTEIISNRKTTVRGRGRPRNATTVAPTNGVKKYVPKVTGRAGKKVAAPVAPPRGESKIIVSNLPSDVDEAQIKEYFAKSLGTPVRRVQVTYGPSGHSRGIATIVFGKASSATEAASKLDGVLVDKRPMKVEVVVDAAHAPVQEPVKRLSDRVAKPKDQPKKAAAARASETAAKGSTRGGARGGRAGRRGRSAGRPKPKTAEELDAEMTDYFGSGTAGGDAPAGTDGTAPAASGGDDLGMDDIS